MPPILHEKQHTGEFIMSEANGTLSREEITLASGSAAKYGVGQLLGKITADDKFKNYDPDAQDGSEVAAGILYAAKDATGGDCKAVMVCRLAEVDTQLLIGIDAAAVAALAAAHVICR